MYAAYRDPLSYVFAGSCKETLMYCDIHQSFMFSPPEFVILTFI